MTLQSFFLQTMFIKKNKGNATCIYWPISAKSTSFSTEIIRFISFFIFFFWVRLSEKGHKMAQMVRKILSLDKYSVFKELSL